VKIKLRDLRNGQPVAFSGVDEGQGAGGKTGSKKMGYFRIRSMIDCLSILMVVFPGMAFRIARLVRL